MNADAFDTAVVGMPADAPLAHAPHDTGGLAEFMHPNEVAPSPLTVNLAPLPTPVRKVRRSAAPEQVVAVVGSKSPNTRSTAGAAQVTRAQPPPPPLPPAAATNQAPHAQNAEAEQDLSTDDDGEPGRNVGAGSSSAALGNQASKRLRKTSSAAPSSNTRSGREGRRRGGGEEENVRASDGGKEEHDNDDAEDDSEDDDEDDGDEDEDEAYSSSGPRKKRATAKAAGGTSASGADGSSAWKGTSASGSESGFTLKKKVPWTREEDAILIEAVKRHNGRAWKLVAELLPGRTHSQAAHRWQKVLDPNLRKGAWTDEEDQRLEQAVKMYNEGQWSRIAELVETRNGKQCRERWRNQISPMVDKRPWSREEDNIICTMVAERGPRWSEIARELPGRTENAVKNRWNARLYKPESERDTLPVTPSPATPTGLRRKQQRLAASAANGGSRRGGSAAKKARSSAEAGGLVPPSPVVVSGVAPEYGGTAAVAAPPPPTHQPLHSAGSSATELAGLVEAAAGADSRSNMLVAAEALFTLRASPYKSSPNASAGRRTSIGGGAQFSGGAQISSANVAAALAAASAAAAAAAEAPTSPNGTTLLLHRHTSGPGTLLQPPSPSLPQSTRHGTNSGGNKAASATATTLAL